MPATYTSRTVGPDKDGLYVYGNKMYIYGPYL